MSSALLRLLALLVACLLTSCIDGEEEYWFNASGGGRARLTYKIPEAAARFGGGEDAIRAKVAAFLQGNESFTSSRHEVQREGDRLRVTVEVEFRSARDLRKLSTQAKTSVLPDSARYFSGETSLEMHGLTLDFTRRIAPGKAMPGAIFLPRRELVGHQLVYIFHLPMQALESNATRTADGGKTLIWEVPLARAIREPIVTRFKARIPLPRWLWLTASSIGIGILAGAWFLIRLWKKQRTVS